MSLPSTPLATQTSAFRTLSGIGEVAERYDGVILDLWGCIHDGVRPFAGVAEALRRLKAAGKRVLVVSNAPRRSQAVVESMERLGLARALYDGVLSSGEVTWQALARRDDPWHARLGTRCFHIGPERDFGLLEGNGLTRVAEVDAAEFVLVTGPNDDSLGVEDHADILMAAVRRRLAMVCANPDLDVVRGGARLVCAGALAARYVAAGGEVRYHGKPYASVYDRGLEWLGVGARARVLAVGDSRRTDIAGALAAGLDCAFIPGGVHGEELGVRMGETPPAEAVTLLARRHGAMPTYVLSELRW